MDKWNVLKSEYIYKTPFGNLRQDYCELPNGKIIENYYVNELCDWVNVIAVTKEHQIVLVKQYRHGCGENTLEIPGGGVNDNEEAEIAIVRELREETGYTSEFKPILVSELYTNPAINTNKVRTYFICDCYKQYEQDTDETEEIEIQLVHINAMEKIIRDGRLKQIFSVAAYCLSKKYIDIYCK